MFGTVPALSILAAGASALKVMTASVKAVVRKMRTSRRSKENNEVLGSRVDDLAEKLLTLAATWPELAADVHRLLRTLERAEALVASRRQGRNCLRTFCGGGEGVKKIKDINRQIDDDLLSLLLGKLMMADTHEGRKGKGIYMAPRSPGRITESPRAMQVVDMRSISKLTFKAGAAYQAAKVMSGKDEKFESVAFDVKLIRDTLSRMQERDLALVLPLDHWEDMSTPIEAALEGVHRLVGLHKRKGTISMCCCFGGIGLRHETRKVKEQINRALLRLSYYFVNLLCSTPRERSLELGGPSN